MDKYTKPKDFTTTAETISHRWNKYPTEDTTAYFTGGKLFRYDKDVNHREHSLPVERCFGFHRIDS